MEEGTRKRETTYLRDRILKDDFERLAQLHDLLLTVLDEPS